MEKKSVNVFARIGIALYFILLLGIPFYDVFVYHDFQYTGLFSLWKVFLSYTVYLIGWWFVITPCFWIILSAFFLKDDDLKDMRWGCFYPAILLMAIFAVIFVYKRCESPQGDTTDQPHKNGQFYDSQEVETGEVWICTGKKSHAYHSTEECYGIQSCRASKKKISKDEAVKMGRTPCHYCHKEQEN